MMHRHYGKIVALTTLLISSVTASVAQSGTPDIKGAKRMQTNRDFAGFYGSSGGFSAHETETHLAQMHAAGLARDVAKIPLLIQSVRETTSGQHMMTALHSLARIGGPQALQTVGEAVQSIRKTDYVHNYAWAVHARLLAQEAVHISGKAAGASRAHLWLAAYLQNLGYAHANALNAAVKELILSLNSGRSGLTRQ